MDKIDLELLAFNSLEMMKFFAYPPSETTLFQCESAKDKENRWS